MSVPVPNDNPASLISRDDITRVVTAFYARARQHPVLGPVFFSHIGKSDLAWSAHEAKIAAFWRGAILKEPGFSGSPMGAHMRAGNVEGHHFDDWLGLFDETLRAELSPDAAAVWSDLAHRIGAGMRMGVEDVRRKAGDVPKLI